MSGPSVVLLLGGYEPHVTRAETHARTLLDVRQVIRHQRHDKRIAAPVEEAEWLLNFLSAPKVPMHVLTRFGLRALNFHPAPPEYPGVGSASMAIHDKREWHGVTAHVMDEEYDHGMIIRVRRFRIDPRWGYGDLWDRSLNECFALFLDLLHDISVGNPLRSSFEGWTRSAISRKEFEAHESFATVPR